MAKFDVINTAGDVVGSAEAPDSIFAAEVKEHLHWEVVRWQEAKARAGTHKVKTKGEVRGGGRKPWSQKGTGNARAGSSRSPLWVGGGTVHGPTPRDYGFSVNKKVRRTALCSALSQKAQAQQIKVVKSFELSEPKTRVMADILQTLGGGKTLIVAESEDAFVAISARNLPGVTTLPAIGLNVRDVLNHGTLLVTEEALKAVERRLA
ncbi:MAG: 50S ribosomal protein L4 [Myxococcales bacterium]|nr:50S ribosomal protein L4 [Myxococcales bacterium]|tara:strand:+ start:1298 stop:1918 length:621 start_codon:yes stop_codon:yes gene_type:complete